MNNTVHISYPTQLWDLSPLLNGQTTCCISCVAAAAGVTKTESVDKVDNAQHDGYGWGGHGGNGHWDMIDHGKSC